jgi:hypothetical protein
MLVVRDIISLPVKLGWLEWGKLKNTNYFNY